MTTFYAFGSTELSLVRFLIRVELFFCDVTQSTIDENLFSKLDLSMWKYIVEILRFDIGSWRELNRLDIFGPESLVKDKQTRVECCEDSIH